MNDEATYAFNDIDSIEYGSVPRSAEWPKVRAAHLLVEPTCRICGGNKKLNVHHILPYHVYPQLELDQTNLMTLCEGSPNGNHHLEFGHFGDFTTKWNTTIRDEAPNWLTRFQAKTEDDV